MFSRISGDAVLDLLNTVEWRINESLREEDLTTFDLVLQWCVEAGLLSSDEQGACSRLAARDPKAAELEREKIIGLREATYAVLFEQRPEATAPIVAAYQEALAGATLSHADSSWTWDLGSATLLTPRHRIAVGLIDLLRRDDLDRLHQCEDDSCGWVYLDTSPRRNRRWCVASDCGDRNRSRAYYARQKAKTPAK